VSDPSFPERSLRVRRAAAVLCRQMGWAPLHEVTLPSGRRADILALRPDGGFVCIEVKSGVLDFTSDAKWPEYLDYCDAFFFAVDADFPAGMLPGEAGVIVTAGQEAAVLRDSPAYRLAPARRRALVQRFAMLAACRLENLLDPQDQFALSCE